MPGPELIEDHIGQSLALAQLSGELQSAKGYGKPLEEDEGWSQTPEDFRLPFKILKNAGFVPPEVEWMHERARLRAALDAATNDAQRQTLGRQLSELEQKLSLRLEALRTTGAL